MRLFLYPLIFVAGIYAALFVPYDIVVGAFGLGERAKQEICHLGAPVCEEYWRALFSFSIIAYLSMLVISLVALRLANNQKNASRDHDGG